MRAWAATSISVLLLTAGVSAQAASDAVQAQLMNTVVEDCKGRFAAALPILFPEDEPGRALDEMSVAVCLDYAHFLPCKSLHLNCQLQI